MKFSALLISVLLLGTVSFAQTVPFRFNYQGRVVAPDTGEPLDGARTLTFRLYDQQTGGTLLWARQFDVTLGDQGQFDVVLEDAADTVSGAPATPLEEVFDTNEFLFLSLEVSGTPGESDPRLQLTSVPYAMRAQRARTADVVETSEVAEGGIAPQPVSADGTAGGFEIRNSDTGEVMRIDADRIESPGALKLIPGPAGTVRLGGDLKVGRILNATQALGNASSVTAATDGYLTFHGSRTAGSDFQFTLTDANNVTSTFRQEVSNLNESAKAFSVTFPVAKGDSFSSSGNGTFTWTPMGQ